jgi:hypothetical protein
LLLIPTLVALGVAEIRQKWQRFPAVALLARDNLHKPMVLVPLVGGPARTQRCRFPVNGCWWQDLACFLPYEKYVGAHASAIRARCWVNRGLRTQQARRFAVKFDKM